MQSWQRSTQSIPTPPPATAPATAPVMPAVVPPVATLVITTDDVVWGALTGLAGVSDPRQFDTVAELISHWPGRRAAVVIIDARETGDMAGQINRLLVHGAALVPVAIVDEARRTSAAALERQRLLFDHLLLPLHAGTASTVVERAAEEASARLSLTAGDPGLATAAAVAVPVPVPVPRAATVTATAAHGDGVVRVAAPAKAEPPPRGRGALLAVAAIAVLAGIGLWWQLRPATPLPATSAASPQRAKPSVAQLALPSPSAAHVHVDEQVEIRLDAARTAMRARRYIDPAQDNALAAYKSVLALSPGNGEASQGLQRIAELLLARAATALAAHDNSAALRALEAARALDPQHPQLAALDAQISGRATELSAAQVQAAMQAGAFVRAAVLLGQAEKDATIAVTDAAQLRQEIARRSATAQLAELARLAQARITQGQLLEPAGDNARQYLKALQDRAGNSMAAEVARLTELYQQRLVADAHAAILTGAFAQADAWLAELRVTHGSAVAAAALEKELDSARAALDVRASARAEPALPVAERPAAAPPTAPLVATPARLSKPLQVAYPRQAALQNTTGWVQVEVDIDPVGRVDAARVLEASPPGIFDAAALAAVRHGEFRPAIASDGSHLRSTVALRVKFQLDDRK
ncbi:MAG: energy transducer TonB [Pseudomonadota bacterium]